MIHETIYHIITITLATIFAVAAVSKFSNLSAFSKALTGFGVPRSTLDFFKLGVPIGESIITILIIYPPTIKLGALIGLLTMLVFSLFLSYHLIKKNKLFCNCFGDFSSSPISWWAVIRNLALSGLCMLLLSLDSLPFSTNNWRLFATITSVIALTEGWFLWLIQRGMVKGRNGLASDNHNPQSNAPKFSLTDTLGDTITLESLISKRNPVILIFIDPSCGPCEELLPYISIWKKQYATSLTFQIISRGNLDDNRNKVQQYTLSSIAVQTNFEVAELYGIQGTPSAILLSPDGFIASESVSGLNAIIKFITGQDEIENKKTNHDVGLIKKHEGNSRKIETGQIIPKIWLVDSDGFSIPIIENEKPSTLLLFIESGSETSFSAINEAIKESLIAINKNVRIILIADSLPNELVHGIDAFAVDQNAKTKNILQIAEFPAAILIDKKGKLKLPIATGEQDVINLLQMITFLHEEPV